MIDRDTVLQLADHVEAEARKIKLELWALSVDAVIEIALEEYLKRRGKDG